MPKPHAARVAVCSLCNLCNPARCHSECQLCQQPSVPPVPAASHAPQPCHGPKPARAFLACYFHQGFVAQGAAAAVESGAKGGGGRSAPPSKSTRGVPFFWLNAMCNTVRPTAAAAEIAAQPTHLISWCRHDEEDTWQGGGGGGRGRTGSGVHGAAHDALALTQSEAGGGLCAAAGRLDPCPRIGRACGAAFPIASLPHLPSAAIPSQGVRCGYTNQHFAR